MRRNMEEIASAAYEGRIKLWIEHDGTSGMQDQLSLYRKLRSQYSNVGVEIQPARASASIALNGGIEPKDLVKVRCYPGSDGKREQKSTVGVYANYIDRLLSQRAEVSVWERDFDMIRKIAAANPSYKKNVAFEVPLGYSVHSLKKLQQCKLDLSVYVPFGKDWVPYLIGRLAEGRIRRIAVALLDGKGDEHGGKN
jgi:hypothetical protein